MAPGDPTAYVFDRDHVSHYYDATVGYYHYFWHGSTGAVHYGFRGRETRGPQSELLNTNRVMADLAGIGPGMRVLDAGCGVGGSSLWLASERGAQVVGLSLSRRQLGVARQRAQGSPAGRSISFQRADYLRAPFADGSIDVFWALESSCYTEEKGALAREAFRLLRPGGRLVIGDGFLRRRPCSPREQREYGWFKRGLVLPELGTVRELEHALGAAGFADVRSWDKTAAAMPSGRRMHRMCSLAYPLARAGCALGVTSELLRDNVRAGIAQYRMIRDDLIGYAVVRAAKPLQASP